MLRSIVLLLCLVVAPPGAAGEPPRVSLYDTEVRTLASALIDQEYRIFVALPGGYEEAQEAYPTIYVLDADILFGTLVETARLLPLEGFFLGQQIVPETVLVGIAYPGGFQEMAEKRGRDFTPAAEPEEDGAARFFRFFKEQLIPFVESTYRTDPGNRTLLGSSAGGLFVLDSLLRNPGTFHRYVATSPRMDDIIFRREEEYSRDHDDLGAVLFISAGTAGEIEQQIAAGVERFSTRLAGRSYPSLELIHESLAGESHVSAQPTAFTHGLKAVFSVPVNEVSSEAPEASSVPQPVSKD